MSVAVEEETPAATRPDGGRRRPRRERWLNWGLPLLGILSLLVIWELAALFIGATAKHPDKILPSLTQVIETDLPAIGTVDREGGTPSYTAAFELLWKDSLVTLGRVVIGSGIGALIGIGVGFVVALSQYGRRLLEPPVSLLRQLPLLALSILFIKWFGGSDTGIYAFIAFGVSTMLFVNTVAAVRNVPPTQMLFSASLGASKLRSIRTVVVPAIIPELMSGIKIAVGLAWAMALGAEYLGAQEGLGRRILYFELFQYTGRMVAVVGVLIFWALLTHLMLTAIGNRLTRWTP